MSALDRIPAELRERRQWVVWQYETRDSEHTTKVPYTVDGWRASATDWAVWTTFESAMAAGDRFDGLGYVSSPEDPYVGIDLDELNADAGAIMLKLCSYSERSVSGRGAHVIVKASLNGHPRNRSGPLEIYDRGR
jgi:primase-polymerase (primpol)-like protein